MIHHANPTPWKLRYPLKVDGWKRIHFIFKNGPFFGRRFVHFRTPKGGRHKSKPRLHTSWKCSTLGWNPSSCNGWCSFFGGSFTLFNLKGKLFWPVFANLLVSYMGKKQNHRFLLRGNKFRVFSGMILKILPTQNTPIFPKDMIFL